MSLPQYQVEDVVYLVESANVGSLESYRISEVRQASSGAWLYKISVPARPPTNTATYGDRITLYKTLDFELEESALCDYCATVTLALAAARARLVRLEALYQTHCETTGSG